MLQFDKSRTAILIEGLKQKGFIYTERNPSDRRAHFVFLTEKGKHIIPQIQEAVNQVSLVLNQKLDHAKLDCFYATLFQMQHNLVDHVYLVKDQVDSIQKQ